MADASRCEFRPQTDYGKESINGYPQKQEETRKRHALDVRVIPLTVTQIGSKRGEMDIELVEEGVIRTVTVGYRSGIGPTENFDNHLVIKNSPQRTLYRPSKTYFGIEMYFV